jgi:AbrB family looped-hinge helix DNA binding protein
MVYNVIKDKKEGIKVIKEVVKVSETKTNTSSIKRIVIPKTIADAMNLQKGDQLVLELEGDEIKIKKF